MNKLEHAICAAVESAQKSYLDVTGWWLSHGPESYLQHEIARSIVKWNDAWVFTEASPKKIAYELPIPVKGRPSNYARKRFDVVIWQKTPPRVRAVVEIKRTSHYSAIQTDADKLETYSRLKSAKGTAAYLLVYSEIDSARRRLRGVDRRKSLEDRFRKWSRKLKSNGWTRRGCKAFSPHDSEDEPNRKWSWGYALYRFEVSKGVSRMGLS